MFKMAVAESALPASPSSQPNAVAPRIRKNFPETWIWDCIDVRFVIDSLVWVVFDFVSK